jgi:hypothetical protein
MNLNELENLVKESEYLSDEDIKPKDILALISLVREMGEALEFAADSTIGEEGDDPMDCDCAICYALDKYKEMTNGTA